MALRATHARARHWVWLAASVKFLVPFGVLASLGGVIRSWVVPAAPVARIPFTVEQAVQPFALPQEAAPVVAVTVPGSAAFPVAAVLLAVWLIGFAAVLFQWWNRWRHLRAAVRASLPLHEGREVDALRRLRWRGRLPDVELVSSSAKLEPGTFGIVKTVLWLPAGIADRLSEAELDAILAHELCHLRRRDNLWAAVHMAVEALFWFHPLVWWLGGRLIEERERACDEEVVRLGSEPHTYAEGVLKVCEFYLELPLACAAGVTGGELRKRIQGIMASRFIRELCFWKKALLTALLAAAVACPLLFGVFKAEAQTVQSGDPSPRFEEASIKLSSDQARQKRAIAPAATKAVSAPDGAAPLASFEVASVTLSGPRITGMGVRNSPTSVEYSNLQMVTLLRMAFGVKLYQLSAPEWVESKNVLAGATTYVIKATFPYGTPKERIPLMLQSLLIERFGLKYHREVRELPVYSLVSDGEALKLKNVETEPYTGKGDIAEAGRVNGHHLSLDQFAAMLSRWVDRPVLDRTGIEGRFNIDLKWAADEDAPGPSLFTAIREQLGLKLVATKAPITFIIVDQLNRVPTEN